MVSPVSDHWICIYLQEIVFCQCQGLTSDMLFLTLATSDGAILCKTILFLLTIIIINLYYHSHYYHCITELHMLSSFVYGC